MESNSPGTCKPKGHRALVSIRDKGINENCPAYRLYQNAKKLGNWNPADLDFAQDRRDWGRLNHSRQEWLLLTLVRFLGGEEAVTLDLLPLISAIADSGHLEETMYLTTFLLDEAKHIEFFDRYLKEVIVDKSNLPSDDSEHFQKIINEELPRALGRLTYDQSPEALAIASTTYHIIVESILGQFSFKKLQSNLGQDSLMPGLLQGITFIQKDESRHIAYGTFLLQRLIGEDEHIWTIVDKRIKELLPHCLALFHPAEKTPILQAAATRLKILQQAQGNRLAEIYKFTDA